MSLREEIEKRRAEEGYVPNPCYTKKDHVMALRVETSSGEVWILPWHHFVVGRHEAGEHERLLLTFGAHKVMMHGLNLGEMVPEIVNQRVEWLRTTPRRYLKSAGREPLIDQICVRSLTASIVAE